MLLIETLRTDRADVLAHLPWLGLKQLASHVCSHVSRRAADLSYTGIHMGLVSINFCLHLIHVLLILMAF